MGYKVTLPAILSKAETRVDGSIKLTFDTRELGSDAAVLFGMARKEGWLLFSPQELDEADIPDEKPDSMVGQKTIAQRIRNIIFIVWKQRGAHGDFESFYRSEGERIIEHYKEMLE
jgi:hypothetical protein